MKKIIKIETHPIPYDNNPKYKGVINYASNGVKDKKSAFEYGFRLGWQTCWFEFEEQLKKLKNL